MLHLQTPLFFFGAAFPLLRVELFSLLTACGGLRGGGFSVFCGFIGSARSGSAGSAGSLKKRSCVDFGSGDFVGDGSAVSLVGLFLVSGDFGSRFGDGSAVSLVGLFLVSGGGALGGGFSLLCGCSGCIGSARSGYSIKKFSCFDSIICQSSSFISRIIGTLCVRSMNGDSSSSLGGPGRGLGTGGDSGLPGGFGFVGLLGRGQGGRSCIVFGGVGGVNEIHAEGCRACGTGCICSVLCGFGCLAGGSDRLYGIICGFGGIVGLFDAGSEIFASSNECGLGDLGGLDGRGSSLSCCFFSFISVVAVFCGVRNKRGGGIGDPGNLALPGFVLGSFNDGW